MPTKPNGATMEVVEQIIDDTGVSGLVFSFEQIPGFDTWKLVIWRDPSQPVLEFGNRIAELTADPGAEIYSASGVRMKLEGGKLVGLPSKKDPDGAPPVVKLLAGFGEDRPFAYRR